MGFYDDINRNEASNYALKYFVRTIHSLSKLDECNVSFIKTKRFIETGYIDGMTKHDYKVIDNLKAAFSLIIDNSDILGCDLNTLLELNKQLGNGIITGSGKLRSSYVYIENLSIQLSIEPIQSQVLSDEILDYDKKIKVHLKTKEKLDLIFDMGSYIIKKQPFFDGNKRTAFLFMNLLLIKQNLGIIMLSEDKIYGIFQQCLENLFVLDDNNLFKEVMFDNILMAKLNFEE